MKFSIFASLLLITLALTLAAIEQSEAYHKHHKQQGHVKIKVWRGPSHGYKKHKYAPFGYHFSVDEKGK